MPKRHDNDTEVIAEGSSNVFADLGINLSPEDVVKIAIARQITKVIVANRYTQVQAAKILDIDQAKVSNITRGRLSGFSAERLMKLLVALGYDLNIEMRRSKTRIGHVTITGDEDGHVANHRQFA